MDIFAPRPVVDFARQKAAWEAVRAADVAWKLSLRTITLAEYNEAQPTVRFDDDGRQTDEQRAYEDRFFELDFGIDVGEGLGLETIAWVEEQENGTFLVWGYTGNGEDEVILGAYYADFPVYIASL